jgi:hypothetical protein
MRRVTLAARRRLLAALRRIAPTEREPAESPGESEQLLTDGGPAGREDADHLEDVPDGAGCAEIWEHLSGPSAAESDD